MPDQQQCIQELEERQLIPKKFYGQVFTTDEKIIDRLVEEIQSIYRQDTRVVEIGGGLGYISQKLEKAFENIDIVEYDDELFEVLNKKFAHSKNIRLIKGDILEYDSEKKPYILVGNIPFHISGRLYRKFMSEVENRPYGMVFITDKHYAQTLMGQPPRCYRVSLQAQAYGDIEIVEDVAPTSVYPEPKVMSCIMKIKQNDLVLPKDFWKTVNYHFENFPTKEVESPKTVGLQGWIDLCK